MARKIRKSIRGKIKTGRRRNRTVRRRRKIVGGDINAMFDAYSDGDELYTLELKKYDFYFKRPEKKYVLVVDDANKDEPTEYGKFLKPYGFEEGTYKITNINGRNITAIKQN